MKIFFLFFREEEINDAAAVTATAFYGLSFVSATYYGASGEISKRSTDFDKTQYSTLEGSYLWLESEKSEKFLRISHYVKLAIQVRPCKWTRGGEF